MPTLRRAATSNSQTPERTRRLIALIATLTFLDEALWVAVVPLLPRWQEAAHLSKGQVGIVLGAYSAAVIVASLPVGLLVDRIGPKRLTVASTALFATTVPLLAVVDTFAALVAARFAQGLFSAVSWTAGLAWLMAALPAERRPRSLSVVSAASSAAAVLGPAFGGPVVAALGLAPAMLGLSAIVGITFVWCVFEPQGTLERPEATRLGDAVRRGARERGVRAAILAMLFEAGSTALVQLLTPLHLDRNGWSAGRIGWVFTVAACVGIAASIGAARLAPRVDLVLLTGCATAGVGVVMALFALPLPIDGYAGMVALSTLAAAPLRVLLYPLCGEGAERAGIGQGIAMGALNATWAAGTLASPVALGTLAEAVGDDAAFAVMAVWALGTVALLLRARSPAGGR